MESESSKGNQTQKEPKRLFEESDLEEHFVTGSGKGGQKVNKTRNNVYLKHTQTGIVVTCHQTRSLEQNRRIARKKLDEKLDLYFHGTASKLDRKIRKAQRNKARKRKRALQKYHQVGKEQGEGKDNF